MRNNFYLIGILTILLGSPIAESCSVAFWNDNPQAKVIGRTMDVNFDDMPLMVVTPRDVERHGETEENPLKWKTRYGSVAITMFHTGAVNDGINEQGFTAQLLYLDQSDYGKLDPKKSGLSIAYLAQYMLDNFKTVDEALKSLDTYQVRLAENAGKIAPLHLAIQDSTGDSAVVEFIAGKAVIHHGKEYNVMTNEPVYSKQLSNLKKYKLFGGNLAMPGDADPLSRFVRLSSYMKTLPTPKNEIDAVTGMLSVIRTVMVPFGAEDTSGFEATVDAWPTRWITLTDLTHKTYYFSSTSAPNIVWVDLDKLQFTPGSPVLQLDPRDISLQGDVSAQLKR